MMTMRMISTAALGAALALGGLASQPAFAQKNKKEEAPKQRSYKLSKGVRENVAKAQQQITANDLAGADASLAAATPLAANSDDKYVIAITKLNVANKKGDQALLGPAVDELLASGGVPVEDQPLLYRNQGALAFQAKNYVKAEEAYGKLAELTPNDSENLVAYAEIQYQNRKAAPALATIDRAIAARKASGQPVAEAWYKRALAIAYEAKMKPEVQKWSTAYLQAYPSPTNWRTALQLYRTDAQLDDQASLDVLRLQRATKALNGERDYFDYANTAYERGLPGEAVAVISEGFAAKMADQSSRALNEVRTLATQKVAADKASLAAAETRAKAAADGRPALGTADAYLGYGDYAKAVALYRVALTKGGVDANVANTRLGIALAQSGNKAEALQAFAAVTGPRKTIADYWTIYLNQSA